MSHLYFQQGYRYPSLVSIHKYEWEEMPNSIRKSYKKIIYNISDEIFKNFSEFADWTKRYSRERLSIEKFYMDKSEKEKREGFPDILREIVFDFNSLSTEEAETISPYGRFIDCPLLEDTISNLIQYLPDNYRLHTVSEDEGIISQSRLINFKDKDVRIISHYMVPAITRILNSDEYFVKIDLDKNIIHFSKDVII